MVVNIEKIEKTTAKEIRSRLAKNAYSRRVLFSLNIEVTSKCNSKCIYCIRQNKHGVITNPELSIREYKGLFVVLSEMGTAVIALQGGRTAFEERYYGNYLRSKKSRFVSCINN